MKYECVCGYVYDEAAGDPENGIQPGTKWRMCPMILFALLAAQEKTHFRKVKLLQKIHDYSCN